MYSDDPFDSNSCQNTLINAGRLHLLMTLDLWRSDGGEPRPPRTPEWQTNAADPKGEREQIDELADFYEFYLGGCLLTEQSARRIFASGENLWRELSGRQATCLSNTNYPPENEFRLLLAACYLACCVVPAALQQNRVALATGLAVCLLRQLEPVGPKLDWTGGRQVSRKLLMYPVLTSWIASTRHTHSPSGELSRTVQEFLLQVLPALAGHPCLVQWLGAIALIYDVPDRDLWIGRSRRAAEALRSYPLAVVYAQLVRSQANETEENRSAETPVDASATRLPVGSRCGEPGGP